MPSINECFLRLLKSDYRDFPNFIETGTYLGETIFNVEPLFSHLFTIEIKNEFFIRVRQRYQGNKIQFILGDSSEQLAHLIPSLTGKSIFFLDGHWSYGDTGRGKKDIPLIEEIDHICKYHQDDAIVNKCQIIRKRSK